MEAIQKAAILVVKIGMLLFFSNSALAQESSKSNYFYFTSTSKIKDSFTVRGVVLSDENLQPISGLMPVIAYCNHENDEKFVFDYNGVYNAEDGTFQLQLPKGKYKFRSSQVGYHEIETEWLNLEKNISIVFILKEYESGGFHD